MSLLEDMRKEKRENVYKATQEGLANCKHCDGDYVRNQVIIIEDEKSCPYCKNPEYKTYYYQN
jgi:hypothetical protein